MGGKFPKTYHQAIALPGLGRYSASAILSRAYGLDLPVVDGNVTRVLSRLAASRHDPKSTAGQKALWQLAERLLPRGRAGEFNQALMELGATVCTPRSPRCPVCPLLKYCAAYRQGRPERYPVKGSAPATRSVLLACVWIQKQGKVLLVRESDSRWYRDLWHLPFFEMTSSGVVKESLRRAILQRFGLRVQIGHELPENRFTITTHRVAQRNFTCKVLQGTLTRLPTRQTRWISPTSLKRIPLPSSQRGIAKLLCLLDENQQRAVRS